MKKERIYTGYAVVSKDILDDKKFKKGDFGISLDGRDLETCKRYCYNGSIVVRTFREVFSKSVCFKWIKKYPYFSISRRHTRPCYIQLWHLRIDFETHYTNGYEREIVYENNDK